MANFFESIKKVGIILPVISMFVMRPSHLGEAYNFLSSLLLIGSSFVLMVLSLKVTDLRRDWVTVPILMILFWFYLLWQGIVSSVLAESLYYSVLLSLIVGVAAMMLFSSRLRLYSFAHVLVVVLALLGYSSIFTLFLNIQFGPYGLVLGKLPIPTYSTGDLLFPFSLGYNIVPQPWGPTYRLSGFWREVGIAQAIFSWAIAVLLFSHGLRWRKFLILGAVSGALASQSTLAFINVALVFILYFLIEGRIKFFKKAIAIASVTPIAIYLFSFALTDPTIGLSAKLETASFSDRMVSINEALWAVSHNPFGYGMYGNDGIARANSGITLISSVAAIGIPGAILYVLIWVGAIFADKTPIRKAVCILPIFLTALTSQPLIDSFGIYIILMLPAVIVSKPEFLMLTLSERGSKSN